MILDDIVAATKIRVAKEKSERPFSQLEKQLPDVSAPRPFAAALKHPNRLGLIAEIKRRSPSKGVLCAEFDHKKIARQYRDGGADCLSVLTEPDFFDGRLQYLKDARAGSSLPCLRKDFIIDEYQITQARIFGADCILLIAAILTDWQVRCFKAAAHRYGMDALFEVHDETEARRATNCGCDFIGVNNRNLQTFELDLATTEKLRPLLPQGATIVGESGVFSGADAKRLREAGADAILVGESLMKADDVGAAIKELIGEVN